MNPQISPIKSSDNSKTKNIIHTIRNFKISNAASWLILGAAVLIAGGMILRSANQDIKIPFQQLQQKETTPLITTAKGIDKFIGQEVKVQGILNYESQSKIPFYIKFKDGTEIQSLESPLKYANKVPVESSFFHNLGGKKVEVSGLIYQCKELDSCIGIGISSPILEAFYEDGGGKNRIPLTEEIPQPSNQLEGKESFLPHFRISKENVDTGEVKVKIGEIFEGELILANQNFAMGDLSEGPIQDIKISINTSENLQLLDEKEQYISKLKYGESKTFKLRFKVMGGNQFEGDEGIDIVIHTKNAENRTINRYVLVEITKYSDCELIENFDKKGKCYQGLLGKFSPENCEKIIDQKLKDLCYLNVSESSSDCGKIIDPKLKDVCGLNLVDLKTTSRDEKLCEQISDIIQKDQCFNALAHQNKDYNFCFSISDDAKEENGNNLKSMCLRDIAVMTDNASICLKITLSYYRDWCYLDLGAILKNPALCDKIESTQTKNLCEQESKKN